MATKKATTKKPAAKKAPVKKPAPKKAPEKKAPEYPKYLDKGITDFVVGTEDYRAMIQDFNDLKNTAYNTWRVKPAILYGIYKELKEHYGLKV